MALLPAQGACSQGGRSGGCIGLVGDMVEAMTSTIIESEKRTGEIPVNPEMSDRFPFWSASPRHVPSINYGLRA